MKKRGFLTSEAFSYAWKAYKDNWKILLVITIITAILGGYQYEIKDNEPLELGKFIISILFGVLSMIVNIGVLKSLLKIYDRKKIELLDIFRYTNYFWRYLGASILYGLIIFAGLILFVVPGIIWALKYSMTLNLIVDKDFGIMDALKKSAEMTNGYKAHILLFYFSCLGVLILGVLFVFIGLIVAIPVVWIAGVYVYRHLLVENNS